MRSLLFLLSLGLLTGFFSGCLKPQDLEKTRAESASFLAENAKKPGVKVTASGLQYEVLKQGQGVRPAARDRVRVNYRGQGINGQTFDSGEGIEFSLLQVIPGWTEGLQLMPEGSRYRFYIPSDLAYGDQGAGSAIAPGAALIFDVDLVKVNPG